jgi:nitric oxide dioxygenase
MLDQETVRIVKSTAPILQEHGETLTKHFYKRMFLHNPEVAPFFNPSNQVSGTQQRALAGAIAAYAANIDNLQALGGAVELIANKHVSLQIKAEHYPIVGQNLLASIKEVLGDAATDEIIEAWGKAYNFLAYIMIDREKQIYEANASKDGGWEGLKTFKVERKEKESSVITSFYLKPEDGGQVPHYSAGQYITVQMPTVDGSTTMRNYSLSDKPGQDYFRISVKKETGSEANSPKGYVSNKLHDEIKVGDTVEIGPPCGDFFLNIHSKHGHPVVLLAAGVGITPILSILKTALEILPDREVIFVHGCLNEEVQAFKATVDELEKEHSKLTVYYRYSNPLKDGMKYEGNTSEGFVDAELIESLFSSLDADYYFCGPKPFMVNVYQKLHAWGICKSQVHFEFFGPLQELENSGATK